jgi:hypothetical protein
VETLNHLTAPGGPGPTPPAPITGSAIMQAIVSAPSSAMVASSSATSVFSHACMLAPAGRSPSPTSGVGFISRCTCRLSKVIFTGLARIGWPKSARATRPNVLSENPHQRPELVAHDLGQPVHVLLAPPPPGTARLATGARAAGKGTSRFSDSTAGPSIETEWLRYVLPW